MFLSVSACTAETLVAVMSDYYETLEQATAGAATTPAPVANPTPSVPSQKPPVSEPQPPPAKEEDPKEPSMLCNESLQIPKAFPFTSESNFMKATGFYDPVKPVTVMPIPQTGYQVGSIKIPPSRFNASPEVPSHIVRRMEPQHAPPPLFETPKRLKRRMVPQVPQVEQPVSYRGLSIMDPYSIILDEMAMLHNPEYSRSEKYMQTTNISEKVKKWIKFEYFYSGIDKPYFEKNELQECLTSLGIPYKCLRRADFILIRKAIGKPRRFSAKFLEEERQKLKRYREISRDLIPFLVGFLF